MIFDRLANFIVRRYKIVIIAWLVVIFYALPLMFNVNDVIAYQETEFLDTEFDSQMAAEIISEQFPSDLANSSMIIILVGEDLSDTGSRDFVLDLRDEIWSDTDFKYLDQVTTIYDVYLQSLIVTANSLAPEIYGAEERTTQTLDLLFEVPIGYFQTFEAVNMTAQLVYGIPAMFFSHWWLQYQTAPYLPGDVMDQRADENASAELSVMLSAADPQNASLMSAYYGAFYGSWSYLGSSTNYTIDYSYRLQQSIDLAIAAVVPTLPPEYSEMAQIVYSVRENLTLVDFPFPEEQADLASAIAGSEIAYHSTDEAEAQIAYLMLYSANETWKASFASMPDLSVWERAPLLIDDIQNAFLANFANDTQEYVAFSSMLSFFDLSSYSDQTSVHEFVMASMADALSIQDTAFLNSIYLLGPEPSSLEVAQWSEEILLNGTLATYPISLPGGIVGSFLSDDDTTMLVIVTFTKGSSFREANGEQPIVDNVKFMRELVATMVGEYDSLQAYITGEAPINADMSEATDRDLKLIEPVTIAMVIVLMSLFFRSILAPFVPLGSIGIGLGISQAVIFFIGSYVAEVHYTVLSLLIAILFGVGTDYSIFVLARYREERIKGLSNEDAMRKSITWAGESITTSGMTVMISFGAISISSFAMLRTMGLVLALAVSISLLVSLTLVPSIALILGRRLFWPISGDRWKEFRIRYLKKRALKRGGYFRHAARISVKHAWPIFIIALLVSVPTTYAYLTQETSYDFIGGMSENESIDGLNAMTESFGAGRISPTSVVIQFGQQVVFDNGSFDLQILDLVESISLVLSEFNNVHEVASPTRPNGEPINYSALSHLPEIERDLLQAEMMMLIGVDNRTVLLELVFDEAPYTKSSMELIVDIRGYLSDTASANPLLQEATVLVGGESAGMVDVDEITSDEFRKMQIIVIIGVFIVLLLVLGSVMLPLFAILSIALSISWTLAATLFVFDLIFAEPVLWLLPVVLFVVLMGLGMDYNVFILTRIREEMQKRGDHAKAIVEAVDRTGGIITACAIIMAGAFGTLMLSSTAILQEFGFALSFAVLLDAMLVRTYLTPAIMKILGPKWTWWAPGRMQRVRIEMINPKQSDPEFDEEL